MDAKVSRVDGQATTKGATVDEPKIKIEVELENRAVNRTVLSEKYLPTDNTMRMSVFLGHRRLTFPLEAL